MSTFTKIVVKDTNYSDRIQSANAPTLVVQDTANLTTTFDTAANSKRINITTLSSEFDQNQVNTSLNERVKITAVPSAFSSYKSFKLEMQSVLNTIYLNHLTSIQRQQRTQTNDNADFIISYTSDYNYYSEGYENFISSLDEKQIGNYYVEKDPLNTSKIYGFMTPNKEYFDSIGTSQIVTVNEDSLESFKNCIFNNGASITSEINKYPFYFNFKFDTHANDNLTNFINDTGLVYDLMDFYVNAQPTSTTNFDLLFTGNSATVQRNVTTRIFPFATWLTDTDYTLSNVDKIKIIGDNYAPISNIQGNFTKLTLNGIFRNKVKQNLRTIQEVIENKKCNNQVLFYKIEKYINNFVGAPTQTFWFPNKKEAIEYYDTQVKYGTPYAYRMIAYTLIIGNSYQYTNPEFFNNDGEYSVIMDVINFPSAQLVEIPLIEYTMASIQNPPTTPEISFSTKMNSDNNLKITLSHRFGNLLGNFFVLEDGDRTQERLMSIVSHNYNGNSGKLYFNNDENPVYYEVYRINFEPKSYSDFVGFKIGDAKQFFTNSRQSSSHVSINDYVSANTDYFYMFRTVNIHGHVSNPSEVYIVSLIQDADDSKLSVKLFNFPKPKMFDNSKKFNSLMQVRPALGQIVFDNDQPALFNETSAKNKLNNIRLGDTREQIWGNTFKIRCTSSTTGKKIDFNITFNIKTVNSEENFD